MDLVIWSRFPILPLVVRPAAPEHAHQGAPEAQGRATDTDPVPTTGLPMPERVLAASTEPIPLVLESAAVTARSDADIEAKRAYRRAVSKRYRTRKREQQQLNGSEAKTAAETAAVSDPEPAPKRRRLSSASPKRHTLTCTRCARQFTARAREARFCSDCRLASQAEKAAERRALPPNPREAWPAEIGELASKLDRVESLIAMEHDWNRVAVLRKQLMTGTAKLEQLKASLMAAEQPGPTP